MTDAKKPKPFALDPPQTSFVLRDLDNAQPVWPRPKGLNLTHPRLAPSGMAGIKPSGLRHSVQANGVEVRVSVNVATNAPRPEPTRSARPRLDLGQEGEASRAFAPLASKTICKSRTR